jgi:hypothetical protein
MLVEITAIGTAVDSPSGFSQTAREDAGAHLTIGG